MPKYRILRPLLSPGSLSSLRALTRKISKIFQIKPYTYQKWFIIYQTNNRWHIKKFEPKEDDDNYYYREGIYEIIITELNAWQTPKQLEYWILNILDNRRKAVESRSKWT